MTAKFNFDFTGANITQTDDVNSGKPIKYTITPVQGAGVPAKVEIDINQGTAKCEFDVYYYYEKSKGGYLVKTSSSPDRDAPYEYYNLSSDYGCNEGRTDDPYGYGYIFSDIFSDQYHFANTQTKTVIPKHNDVSGQNYCEFSVNMRDGEDCNDLNYCQVFNNDFKNYSSCDASICTEYPCGQYFFQNLNKSPITAANTTLIPPGTIITSINITCPSSLPIPYSYSGFIPTFNSASRKLTFTLSPGITGTQSLGGTDPNSVPTTISNIDKWTGDFDMNFVCNNGKLFTSWGDMNFEGCGVNL